MIRWPWRRRWVRVTRFEVEQTADGDVVYAECDKCHEYGTGEDAWDWALAHEC